MIKTCPKCNKEHEKLGKFCSYSCANSRGPRTEEFKEQVRNKLSGRPNPNKGKIVVQRLEKKCPHCDTRFLTTEKENKATCGDQLCVKKTCREAGKKSAANRKTRSLHEIELFHYCEAAFPNVLSNSIIADGWDADIVIPDYKVAVLWNGPWHYKEMNMKNHSLSQVQNRDRIKTRLFESLGWTVLVYEDRYYTPESAFKDLVLRVGFEPTK